MLEGAGEKLAGQVDGKQSGKSIDRLIAGHCALSCCVYKRILRHAP
jgi:hypothetical protein